MSKGFQRCDSGCHTARSPRSRCCCLCSGNFHGRGATLNEAIRSTSAAELRGLEKNGVRVGPLRQLILGDGR